MEWAMGARGEGDRQAAAIDKLAKPLQRRGNPQMMI